MSQTKTSPSPPEETAVDVLRAPAWYERLLFMGRSRAVELDEHLEDPFPAPKAWGKFRWRLDETVPSLLLVAAAMICVIGLLLLVSLITVRPPVVAEHMVDIQQVDLGTGAEQGGGSAGADPTNTPAEQQEATPVASSQTSSVQGNIETQTFRPTEAVQEVDPAKHFERSPERAQRMKGILNGLEQAGKDIIDLGKGGTIAGVFKVDKSVKSVVYVVDRSGSMGSNQALERVKAELLYAVQNLSDQQRFSVIFFDHAIYPLGSELPIGGTTTLVSANATWKKKTEDFCDTIFPNGGTDPREAMRLAISLHPELIYLLSDGEFDPACVGEITTANKQQSRPSTIHCVGLGEVIVTLHDIAKQNRGVYFQAR